MLLFRTLVKSTKPKSTPNTIRTKAKSIDKFFPKPVASQKEWDKRGIDKDEFFRKKYSFMNDERKKALDRKVDRQKRYKQLKEQQKYRKYHEDDTNPKPERQPLGKTSLYEYIYGTHAVKAALKANKRTLFHRLVVQNKVTHSDIIMSTKKYDIKVEERSKNDLNILTNNGIHNGVVLESRPLQLPTIHKLGDANQTYTIDIWNQFYTKLTAITKPIVRPNAQFPFAIYLDEITDPQNIGAIIRSAYFLGVDFVVTPSYNSAKLGPVAAKASAGALDTMDIYQVDSGLKFMRDVQATSWTIIATDLNPGSKFLPLETISTLTTKSPVMLILGSEGAGVRTNLKNLAHYMVKIDQNRINSDDLINSLNVNAATSILLSKFLI